MHQEYPPSIYLSIRSGSRARAANAARAFDYISRAGRYDDSDRDPALYTESGHMPSWAEANPRTYWDAADLFERANGCLYVSAIFGLPPALSEDDRLDLSRALVHGLTDEERLPYTLAIHAGLDENGEEHNPHAHLIFSERRNDGIERDRALWFRRWNARDPEHGGALKSTACKKGRHFVEQTRARWAELVNKKLEERGRSERVDHRSYERRGLDRESIPAYRAWDVQLVRRGERSERLEDALAILERERQRQDLDREIERLEALRASIIRDGLPDDRRDEPRAYGVPWRGRPTDELTRGR